MVNAQQLIKKFQDFRGDYNLDSAVGGLLLELVENGGGGNSSSGATAENQAAQITELEALVDKVATKTDQDEQDLAIAQLRQSVIQLKDDWLAENATEAKQQEIIALLTPTVWGNSISDSIPTTNDEILPAVSTKRHFLICNTSTVEGEYIYLNVNAPASPTSAILVVQPLQTVILREQGNQQINAIASSGTINFTYQIGV